MKYLNSKLTGEAKHAVSGIIFSNDNYQVAVTLMKERFGDIQTVIKAHYTAYQFDTCYQQSQKVLDHYLTKQKGILETCRPSNKT